MCARFPHAFAGSTLLARGRDQPLGDSRDDVTKGEPLTALLNSYDHEAMATWAVRLAKADTAGPAGPSSTKTALHGATSATLLHLATFEYLLALCAARSVVGGPQALVDEARQRLALAADHGGDIDRTILRPRTGEGLALNPDVPFGSEPAPPEELASDRSDVKDSANALLTALSDLRKALDRFDNSRGHK